MAIKPDYQAGLATLAAGGTTVTFSGGANITAADIQPGDSFHAQNLFGIIATVTDATHVELTAPWTGTALAASPYRVRFQPDGSRYAAALRDLVGLIGNGIVQGLSSLGSAARSFVYYDAGGNPQLGAITDASVAALSVFEARSIFVLVTGQSNATLQQAYTWSPPKNLKVWNYNFTQGNVGTAFATPLGNVMSLAMGIGKRLAERNPDKTIYIVNIALSGNTIEGWLPGAPAGKDVYADILLNIPPALAAAGVTKIDEMHWRQGESDRALSLATVYPGKFETVVDRFRTNNWFPASTPIIVHGIVSSATSGDATYGPMNKTLQKVVNTDPQRRKFVYSGAIPTEFWTDTPKIHMTGAGYEQAGALAADASRGRANGVQQPFIVDTDSGELFVEEVPFVPVVVGTTTGGTGTYTTQIGRYWKTGRKVDFQIDLTWTAHTGTGRIQINGLPFGVYGTWSLNAFFSNLTYTGQVGCRAQGSSTGIIQVLQAASGAAFEVVPMDTSASLTICGFYYTP